MSRKITQNMEGEMRNFAMVWTSVVAALCYCQAIGKVAKPGPARLLPILPVVLLFLLLPLTLRTIFLGGPTSFFVAWLATFKLLLFASGRGPLSSDLPPSRFVSLACFPIKIHTNADNESSSPPKKKSRLNYTVKAAVFATIVPVFLNKAAIHPGVFLFLYAVYTYTGLDIILAAVAATVRAALGVELEPQFDEPYLATSLQDFWGRRWNLAATRILRPAVYVPMRDLSARAVGRRWAPLPAVVAAFLASGAMHELVFYNIGRERPVGDVTLFFTLHGACLATEVAAKKAAAERGIRVPEAVSRPLAVGFVVVTGLWLFLPALMRCEADVMAHREIVAFVEFVKDIGSRLSLDTAIEFSLSTYFP